MHLLLFSLSVCYITYLSNVNNITGPFMLRSGEVEAIKVHHLIPGRHEILNKLHLCV